MSLYRIHTVITNKRSGNPFPKCLPFCGKVFIDDVWSGGSSSDGPYPLISSAMAAGLYHPRCRDAHTTYFPGISTPPDDDNYTKEELKEIENNAKEEAQQQYAERQAEKYGRLAEYSMDKDNKRMYEARQEEWEEKTGAYDISNGKRVYYNELNDYKIQIDDYEESINQQLSESARKVAKYGSENSYEYAAIVDLITGKEVDFGTSEEYSSVNSYYRFLRKHLDGKYAMIHNHNTENSFSLPDIQELVMWENLECICAVTNNGITYSVQSNGAKSKEYLYIEFHKIGEEANNLIDKEILMVKEAIKKYTKNGVKIINGKR